MQKRLEKLTKKQQSAMARYRDEWLRIGLCTDPADRQRAEAGIRKAYEIAGRPAPRIVWCSSPLAQGLTRAIVRDGFKGDIGKTAAAIANGAKVQP